MGHMSEETVDKIVEFLEAGENGPTPQRTLAIAKAVFGKDATCKMVNKHLYGLLKNGRVEKIAEADGSNPRWRLTG